MQRIPESELILNSRGAVYHLDLLPVELAPWVITVGDPDRVKEVSKHFDRLEFARTHREFVTHTGWLGKKRISVVSTGIGTDNIDIVLNELDALVNIDFTARVVKPSLTALNIIRVGTSGSLQEEVPVDSFVTSTHGIGVDNLLHFYRCEQNAEETSLLQAFVTHTQFPAPYIGSASVGLLKHFVEGFHPGITVTCPGFYGPQGRVLRLGLANPEWIDRLRSFQLGRHRIANFEMETSGIYGLGNLLGHHCLSLNAIVANRVVQQFSKNSAALIEKLITSTLERIESI
ncbi:MAG: nucleoside phosphorylase [Chitinophagaceae bacterium]|nr:nucleoside phosphorylase [Chitinophagaceae bacterium]MCW5928350.1 nucleoside phosphorylase [Chitinophagaceae bacterium]